MKASALFGAGWEHDSVEVLWQDAGRAFCRLGRDGAAGDRHAFIPVLSGAEHPTLESINRLTREYELKDYLAADVGVAASGARARARADDAGCRVHRR